MRPPRCEKPATWDVFGSPAFQRSTLIVAPAVLAAIANVGWPMYTWDPLPVNAIAAPSWMPEVQSSPSINDRCFGRPLGAAKSPLTMAVAPPSTAIADGLRYPGYCLVGVNMSVTEPEPCVIVRMRTCSGTFGYLIVVSLSPCPSL